MVNNTAVTVALDAADAGKSFTVTGTASSANATVSTATGTAPAASDKPTKVTIKVTTKDGAAQEYVVTVSLS